MVLLRCLILFLIGSAWALEGRDFPAAPQAQSQNPAANQQGTYRVRVRLIPVDVIVTDAQGRPVGGLRREDFQIFENGRRQEIRQFIVQQRTAMAPAPAPRPAPARVAAPELTPQPGRIFLIMMGRGRFQTPFRSVDALIRFVRNDLLPQDRVAVFAYNRASDFTTDHELAARILERYRSNHERIESWMQMRFSGLAAIYGSKEMPKSFQPEIDRIFADPAGLASREVGQGLMKEAGRMTKDALPVVDQALIPADNPSRNQFTQLESDAITDLPFSEFTASFASTHQDVQNIFSCITYLRWMEGEKHLLFFTPSGLFLPRLEYDNSIAAAANDARVVIDTFQTGGLKFERSWSDIFAISSLRNISQLTGGQASIYRDIGKSLAGMDQMTRVEYLLGYYPADDSFDGKYRRINVRVSRPGLRVSFRHGYYARETAEPYNREEFLAYSRISAAAGYGRDLSDVGFKVDLSPGPDPLGPPKILAEFQLDAGKLGMTMVDGERVGKVYAAVFAADSKGKVLSDVWGTFVFQLTEARYREVLTSGLRFSVLVDRKAPSLLIKVVLYDTIGDRAGSRLLKWK